MPLKFPYKITGAGGGGSTPSTPVEAADSLRSKQYARIIDLVSEGEIGGLVDGLRSVYLNKTPIQNDDGSLNFQNVTFTTRDGTQVQDYIPGFPAVESEQNVGVEVKNATPVVRTISDSAITSARVTLSVPQLTRQDSTGDILGTSVQLAIDVQSNGGGYVAQPLSRAWDSQAVSGVFTSPANSYGIGLRVKASANSACSVTFQIQYKTQAAGAWTVLQTDTLNVVRRTKRVKDNVTGGRRTVSYYAPADRDYYTPDLPADTWMVQVVYVSGSASISPDTAYYQVQVFSDTISGKTTSKYQRTYHIDLAGSAPWDIRVRRITADSTAVTLQNKTFWDTYTELVDYKLSYPNSALMALQVDAQNFSGIPTRGYEIFGLKVQVPSNYDPIARTYTGAWDGTFVTAWTDNPAWCFYDLLTNSRYGLGSFIDAMQVDKWALYTIAQYCDELVQDGYSGIPEPRFTCNLYLQTQKEAYSVLTNMASIFNAILFEAAGLVTPIQDAPADPVAQFSAANVIDGLFSYSGTAKSARHTVALVTWNDPLDQYKPKVEYVPDEDGIALYGVQQTSVVAFGCTSRGQAHRFGRAILYSERLLTETVTFKAGFDAAMVVKPGAVIQIQDPFRSGKRFGGRVITRGTASIGIDDPVTIESGKTYTVSVVLPDGTLGSANVTNGAGSTSTLDLSPALAQVPEQDAIWVLAASDLALSLWRIISIAETGKDEYTITALKHDANKYAAIEQNLMLESPPITSIVYTPDQPSDLVAVESLYLVGLGVVGNKVDLSWQGVAIKYEVGYRLQDGNWITNITTQTSMELLGLAPGVYDFSVTGINALGVKSVPAMLTQTIYGKNAPPADIAGFSVHKIGGLARCSWNAPADLDVQIGGFIIIRHTPKTSGATWQDGITLDAFSGNATDGTVPLMTGTYMAKALDSSGFYSTNIATFLATEGMVSGFNTIGTLSQAPSFPGTLINVVAVDNILKLDSVTLIDSMTDLIDSWGFMDSIGGIQVSGSYEFGNGSAAYDDFGTVATRRFQATITALAFNTQDTIDLRTTNIDSWGSFDGDVVNGCEVELQAAITNDDPAVSPVWSDWVPFMVADFTCRAIKYRLVFASSDSVDNIQISQLDIKTQTPVSP